MAQSITLQTSDGDIIASDVLGRVSFAASNDGSGADAIKIGGSIYAVAESEFTAISNATSIIFATATSDNAADKLKITSGGHFLPVTNNVYDIGSSTNNFRNVYATSGIFDIVSFDTNIEPDLLKGQMSWNDTEGTVNIALTDTVDIHIGEHSFFRVRNETGNVLYKGQVVYASGVHANGIILPNLYTADGTIREVRFMGFMLENLNNNNNGYAIQFGHIKELDTRGNVASNIAVGDETWADGDILYVHPTVPGKLTKVEPKHSIIAAIILDAASNGSIFVRPTSYGHLSDNHDVDVSGLVDNNFLVWNSGLDTWEPSSGLYYVNDSLGIGTSSPNATLHAYSDTPSGTVFNVEGTNGSLFSVVDNLSGVLMSVNTIAGLPVFQVNSDYSIVGGRFNQNDFVITSSGDIGMGTANPTQQLDVRYPAGGGMALLKSTDTTDGLLFGDMAYSASNNYQGIKHAAMGGVNDYMIISDGTHTYISAAAGYNTIISAGGNSADSHMKFSSTEVVINDNSSNLDFRVESDTNANMLFVDGVTDMVGIGTGSPARVLHVKSSSTSNPNVAVIESSDTANNQSILRFKDPSTSNITNEPHIGSAGDSFVIKTANAESVRVDSNGRVGIGTVSPTSKLHVVGDGNITGNVIVGGNLTILGTTVTADVDRMEVEDPIITLGLASGNVVTDTNLDRGLALTRSNGLTAFMGWDTSENEFSLLSSGIAQNSSGNYIPGTYGNLHIGGLIATTANFSSTIDAANLGAGEDNSVVILDSDGKLRTDEIDSRVWGTSLVDGAGLANHVAFWTDNNTLSYDSNQLVWDSTNNRLGIGMGTPATNLHVYGGASGQTASGIAGLFVENNGTSNGNYVFQTATAIGKTFSITNAGNVGIGTTSPSSKLTIDSGDISFTTNGQYGLRWPAGSRLYEQTGATGGVERMIYQPNGDRFEVITENGVGFIAGFHGNSSLLSNSIRFYHGTIIGSTYSSNNSLSPPSNGLLVQGDVGIGTTSPSTKLDVSGVITATGGNSNEWNEAYDWIQASGLDGTGSASGVAFWTDSNTLSNDSALIWDSTNDRLGIGTTSPSSKLHILGGTTTTTISSSIENSSNFSGSNDVAVLFTKGKNSTGTDILGVFGVNTSYTTASVGGVRVGSATNHALSLATNNTERIRIAAGGNVGIGISAPSGTLHVVGDAYVDNLKLDGNTLSTTDTNGALILNPNGTGALQADSGGNARGAYAVDLQRVRSTASQVASGACSVVGGGCDNIACGIFSTVGGGRNSQARGSYSTVSGGYSNIACGNCATISGGRANTASANYSVVGGGAVNSAIGPISTVGGGQSNSAGGSRATVSGGLSNSASSCYSSVAGGRLNTASGCYSAIGGGCLAVASGIFSTVSGGRNNQACGNYSTISGGLSNQALATYATVSGGYKNVACSYGTVSGRENTASGICSTISGGACSTASGPSSTIGGGGGNTVSGNYSTIGGGYANCVTGLCSVVSGGYANCVTGTFSAISGGNTNSISSTNASVSGGCLNVVSARHATIGGGHRNVIQSPTNECCSRGATIGGGVGHNSSDGTLNATTGDLTGTITCCNAGAFSTISGGLRNIATGVSSTVGGGSGNTASNCYSTVSGGYGNESSAPYSTVSGGYYNTSDGNCSTVSGGESNNAKNTYSTVSGGYANISNGCSSTISGGYGNSVLGQYAAVSGGRSNNANGDYSSISGGCSNNSCGYANTHILGSNICATQANTTYTQNIISAGDVTITGHLSAATKSFLINHPIDKQKKLQYGSLESPYHGIRLTGKGEIKGGKCIVKLPDYISSLVRDDDNVNIQITNYRHSKTLYVDDIRIDHNEFVVKCDSWFGNNAMFFWSFTAVRKDVEELKVEF